MNSLQLSGLAAARVLVGVVFLATGFGIIPQAPAAKALADHGASGALVPLLMLAGGTIEIVGGFGLILGIYPQIAAIAVIALLIPATLVGYGFWQVRGTPTYIPQLLQFLKNRCDDGRSAVHCGDAESTRAVSAFLAHIDRLGRLQQSTKRDGRKNA
jgi:putative oxidoreductase